MSNTLRYLVLSAIVLLIATPAFCDTAEEHFKAGNAKQAAGDMDGAITEYTRTIELEPAAEGAYYSRGVAKYAKGDKDGALADYNKAIELDPNDAAAYFYRGNVKRDKDNLDGALADYTKAIQLNPKNGVPYIGRGVVKNSKGDVDGAIAEYSKAIELTPDNPIAYCLRGSAKVAKGDMTGALADYNKAIEFKPDYAGAYINRGCMRYDRHDFNDALTDFRKAVELKPSDEYSRFRVWLIRSQVGEADAATAELKAYLNGRTRGKPGDWAFQIGSFLAGQLTEQKFLAAAQTGDAKAQSGQLCEAYFYAGSKRLIAGDKATAIAYFQKCLATEKRSFTEYTSAVAELKILKPQNN